MRTTKQLSITLTNEMAEMVRAKVESGAYASESEVIRDGLRALQSRDQALEAWIQKEVLPAYDAIKADPSSALSLEDVKASLAERHRKALEKRAAKQG